VNNSNDLTVIKEASKHSIKPTEDKKAHSIIEFGILKNKIIT